MNRSAGHRLDDVWIFKSSKDFYPKGRLIKVRLLRFSLIKVPREAPIRMLQDVLWRLFTECHSLNGIL